MCRLDSDLHRLLKSMLLGVEKPGNRARSAAVLFLSLFRIWVTVCITVFDLLNEVR